MQYTPYQPEHLPTRFALSKQLQATLVKAKAVVSNFNALLQQHDSDSRLLTLFSIQEAIDSFHPRLSLQQILLNQTKPIVSYLSILKRACNLPFNHTLMIKLHQTASGQKGYRKKQNWIGPKNRIEEAYFFPPAPSELRSLMDNLIAYWHRSEQEPLLQLALIFAQFLIIHPFMDGNGRTVRMLIPLFLYQKGLVSQPVFFLSHYFKKNRLAYFQNLYDITSERRWNHWVQFFLKGVIQQGNRNLKEVKRILHLHQMLKRELSKKWSRKKTEKILLFLFQHPIFTQACLNQQIIDFLFNQRIVKRKRIGGKSYWVFLQLLSRK